MKCPYCNREIEPEKIERNDGYGIDRRWFCPKCHMFLRAEKYQLNQQSGWRHIKEIIEKRGKIDLANEERRAEKLSKEIGK